MILKDYCKLIVDCEHNTAPSQSHGYPLIRTPNIGRGRFGLEGVNRVSQETYDQWTKRAVPLESDLILAREAPVGNIAIIKNGQKFCLGQRTVLIRPDKSKVNPEYLMYLILGPKIQGLIQGMANGATVPHLNMQDIRNLKMPNLPDQLEQEKIVAVLSPYDSLIEVNENRINLLEQMAELIYDEWFVKFKFPGRENVKTVGSELGEIPEGWEVKTLGELGEFRNGINYLRDEVGDTEYYIANVRDIANSRILLRASLDKIRIDSSKAREYLLTEDDILIARSASPGEVSLLVGDCEMVIHSGFSIRFRLKTTANRFYIFMVLRRLRRQLENFSTGTALKSVNQDTLKSTKVLIPPEVILIDFRRNIEPIIEFICDLLLSNQNLTTTRDVLLPGLVSGKIDVSNLDIQLQGWKRE